MMDAELQGDYQLRRTRNYFDLVDGWGFHNQPITFFEFMAKPEADFMWLPSFMQVPDYVQKAAEIQPIEEEAREFVRDYIMDEFAHNLLGMQNYVLWADKFRNKCASIAASFWAQVNMHDLMFAKELETDKTMTHNQDTGGTIRKGAQVTEVQQNNDATTTGNTTSDQTVDNTQITDSARRTANADTLRAADQLTNELQHQWDEAANNIQETRERAGDTRQTIHGETHSDTTTNSSSNSTSTARMENSADENMRKGQSNSEYTNKMFMQEKQWAIETAQQLMPLTWLKNQLRPMFYLLY